MGESVGSLVGVAEGASDRNTGIWTGGSPLSGAGLELVPSGSGSALGVDGAIGTKVGESEGTSEGVSEGASEGSAVGTGVGDIV